MPTFSKSYNFTTGLSPIPSSGLNSIGSDLETFLNVTKLDATNIQNGSLTNALFSTTAAQALAVSKIVGGTTGQVLIPNLTTSPATAQWGTVAGPVTFTQSGTTLTSAIAAGSITTAMLAGSIPFTSLATLNAAQILVGNASNVATAVTATGDLTIGNTGIFTVVNNAITTAKINDGAVTTAKHADGSVTSAKIADGTIASGDIADSAIIPALMSSTLVTGVVGSDTGGLPGTPNDITGSSVTFTLAKNSKCLIWFGGWKCQTNGSTLLDMRLNIDGADHATNLQQQNGAAANSNALVIPGTVFVVATLAAGSHTIKLRAGSNPASGAAVYSPFWYIFILNQT